MYHSIFNRTHEEEEEEEEENNNNNNNNNNKSELFTERCQWMV
jgi:hypothetical protein